MTKSSFSPPTVGRVGFEHSSLSLRHDPLLISPWYRTSLRSGVWDVVTNDKAGKVVRAALGFGGSGTNGTAHGAAAALCEVAAAARSDDNISAVVLLPGNMYLSREGATLYG